MANDELKNGAPATSADKPQAQPDNMAEYQAADRLVADSRKAAGVRAWMWVMVIIALILAVALLLLM